CSVIPAQSSSAVPAGIGGTAKSGAKWSSYVAPSAGRACRADVISAADNQLIRMTCSLPSSPGAAPLFLGRRLLRGVAALAGLGSFGLGIARDRATQRPDLVLGALPAGRVLALVEIEVLLDGGDRLVVLVILLVHEAEVPPAVRVLRVEAGRLLEL